MSYTMIKTAGGLSAHECVSALQKHIRRGREEEAMAVFFEMARTGKSLFTWAVNRLRIIAHEDIGLASPQAVIFSSLALNDAEKWYPRKLSWKLAVADVILMLSRAAKSREADHFQSAVSLEAVYHNRVPTIPDEALDKHTMRGKRMGRGVEPFVNEGTQLVPPNPNDPYRERAEEIWCLEEKTGVKIDGMSEAAKNAKAAKDGQMSMFDG